MYKYAPRRFLREVTMMFDATHRFVMASHIVSIDFTKQGWRQFAAVNRRLAARYIRAFILKQELAQYIAAHESGRRASGYAVPGGVL